MNYRAQLPMPARERLDPGLLRSTGRPPRDGGAAERRDLPFPFPGVFGRVLCDPLTGTMSRAVSPPSLPVIQL
jgi:hypothetical protein